MTTRDPHSDALREALRSLPRHRAEEGFTERVLDRLGEPVRARPGWPASLAAALVVAAGLLGVLAAGRWLPGAAPSTAPTEARRQTLEAERAHLEAELAELRRLTTELREDSTPVLYLGGDEEVDLVLDLGRLAQDGYRDSTYRFTTYDQEADRP